MSDREAVRAVALAEANKLASLAKVVDANDVVSIASVFLEFLNPPVAPATRTTAGAEPEKKPDSKPSANTAGAAKKTEAAKPATQKAAKPAKPTEEELAAAALKAAEDQAEVDGDEYVPPSDPFPATKEGVAAAIAAMIENKNGTPNRDTAVALMKKYKANKVTALQAKSDDEIAAFIEEVNTAFGIGEIEV